MSVGGRGGLGEAAASTASTTAADGGRGGWRGSGGEGELGGGSAGWVSAGGGVAARSGTAGCSRHRGASSWPAVPGLNSLPKPPLLPWGMLGSGLSEPAELVRHAEPTGVARDGR